MDGSVNSSRNPAKAGEYISLYATGGGQNLAVTVTIGGQTIQPQYAGPAPGLPGVQQVNLRIPAGYAPGQYFLQICEAAGMSAPVCSPPAWLVVGQ